MRHRALALVLATLGLLGGCGSAPPPLPPLDSDAVILSFGDSLTHGTGAPAQRSYPAVLAELIGRRVIRSGVPGELSAEGLARLPAELDRHRPDLLILCHGGNDMLRKRSMAQLADNLRAMIGHARERDIEVLLIGVPRPAIFGLSSAEPYLEIAEELAVPLLDEALPEILGDKDLKSDAVHPNAAGYAQLAHAVAAYLRAAGAVP